MPSGDHDATVSDCATDRGSAGTAKHRAPPTQPKVFTWKELSKLNRRDNAHVAVRGKVYDVSSFISRHPGGADQLLLGAGRDVTHLFQVYHTNADKVLEKFYVGDLIDSEHPVFTQQTEFYPTLKSRVAKYFKDNNIDPKFCPWMIVRYCAQYIIALLFYIAAHYSVYHNNLLLALPLAACWGYTNYIAGMCLVHDASHFAVTHKPWVWRFLGYLSSDIQNGSSFLDWLYVHVVGHHSYTNIDQADPDISTLSKDAFDIRRMTWYQKWHPRFIYQHLYIYFLYGLMGLKLRLQDFTAFTSKFHFTVRINPLTTAQWSVIIGGKLFFLTYRFIVPGFFLPWIPLILINITADYVGGVWLGVITHLNHVISEVAFPKADENNTIHADWAETQVATTCDYATDSWFWNVTTTALNHQVAHHLFPSVMQIHYPKITPIVRETCQEFGLHYNYFASGIEALQAHHRHMRTVGQAESSEDSDGPHSNSPYSNGATVKEE